MKSNETTLEMPELAKTFMRLPKIAPGRKTSSATKSPLVAAPAGRKSLQAVFFYSLIGVAVVLAVKVALDLNEILASLKVLPGV